jgi:LPXTG-motif cell wall-anchored protein
MNIKAIEDGKVTLEFTHLSPVVFLADNTTEDGGNTDAPASPSTGESNVVLYVALIVVAAATVAVVTRKKMA